MNYLAIKHLHITFAALSGSFFVLRGLWMLLDSPLLQRRWVRIVPHVVDTVLLASALVLVFRSGQYPFVQPWLTAKVLALVAYIVLGAIALKRGKTKGVRTFALFAALATFAYIVAVALTRQAAIPLQALGLGV
ncbi:MAG: SirB2 family protein [Polaromonas sp.]